MSGLQSIFESGLVSERNLKYLAARKLLASGGCAAGLAPQVPWGWAELSLKAAVNSADCFRGRVDSLDLQKMLIRAKVLHFFVRKAKMLTLKVMLKKAALGANSGLSGNRKAPRAPALAQPRHNLLMGCTSTFFSSINAFLPSPYSISHIATSLPSF